MKSNVLFAASLCLLIVSPAFSQGGNAELGGVVSNPSRAVIPGVAITAKNVNTGIASTQRTNQSGIYTFPVLQPGTYEISAELSGFKKSIQKTDIPYAGQIRVNFTLEIGQSNQTADMTASTDSILLETSASVGAGLSSDRIQNLPLVGNNVLDLLETLPGLRTSPEGDSFDTLNGLNIDTINVTRDGLTINDGRYAAGSTTGGTAIGGKGRYLLSGTTLLPDLVGEIRLILSPVDAALGRGNSQIQIQTRSGTNKYSGSAAWYVRNTALDANTWTNNHTPFTDPGTGRTTNSTEKPYRNNHQYSFAYGGPVKIPGLYDGKNKTFFYALWAQNISNTRQVVYTPVLTDTARLGIYRYFPGFAPEGYFVNSAIPNQTLPVTAATASWVAVDVAGNPVPPPGNPDGSPYTASLTCFSMFGKMRLDTNGNMVPFTAADCPNGNAVVPSAASGVWDTARPSADNSGYIRKLLASMPHPNFFGALDGLNLAQYAFMQHRRGSTGGTAQQIADPNANSKQINIKIDHNFNASNKATFNYSYQRDDSDGNVSSWPDGPSGSVVRRPHVFTASLTSTLTPHIVNEARFGFNRNYNSTVPAYLQFDGGPNPAGEQFLLNGGQSLLNPSYSYLVRAGSAIGRVGSATGPLNTRTSTSWTNSMLYSYADTLSWSIDKHALKFGVELRLPRNEGNGETDPYPGITLGNNASAVRTVSPFNTATAFPELPGLLNSSLVTDSGVPADPRTDVTNLLYFLNGSVSSASQFYYIKNFSNITDGRWDDYSTTGIRMKRQITHEMAAFARDDFKVTKHLTLNLGLRWEFYSSPYIEGGLTSTILGGAPGAFGATRTAQTTLDNFNSDPFAYWLRPGNLYLTGYGTFPVSGIVSVGAEACRTGVQQNFRMPVSTCDPNSLSSIQFIGPGSPNPSLKAIPENNRNFGPAIGFAWQLPWFGEGKTTIRGGYQQTFERILVNNSGEANGTDTFIGQIPGSQQTFITEVNDQVYQIIHNPFSPSGTPRALNLSDMSILVPVRPAITPGAVYPVASRYANIGGIYDTNYKQPYTQNMTLSITRQINNAFTLDIRYTGTLGRRQDNGTDLNTANIYHNPELLQALTDARAGTCTANAVGYKLYNDAGLNPCDVNGDPVLLDQMLAGLNLNVGVAGATGTGTFGNVGTVNAANVYQSGAAQLRRSAVFQGSLANGDLNAVANSLLGLIPAGLQSLPVDTIPPFTVFGTTINHPMPSLRTLRNGCDRMANNSGFVQQTITLGPPGVMGIFNPGFNVSNSTPNRCFAEDYLITNSQFTGITYHANWSYNYYHSVQGQLTARPIPGVSVQSTLVWGKSMGLQGTWIDPTNRALNYGAQPGSALTLRMNGNVELPIGPNKLLMGNSSGWVAHAVERWQASFIYNAASADRTTANPDVSHLYGNPGWTIASTNWSLPKGDLQWSGNSGSLYGNTYTSVQDPQCTDPTQVAATDKMGTNLQLTNICTLTALAQRNADGTPGEVMLKYGKPGEVGNLGFNNFSYFGNWTLDMGISKTFKVHESTSVQIRIDASNVLNHPTPGLPLFTTGQFGAVTTKTDERALQGQLRVSF